MKADPGISLETREHAGFQSTGPLEEVSLFQCIL